MWMVLHGYSDAFSVEDIQYNRIKLVSFFCWAGTIYSLFGEWTMWLAWFVFAIPSGSALIVLAPMMVTWLLLKGTGIALMEEGIRQRRPDYAAYQSSTSAFLPAPPSEAVNRGLYD